MPARYSAPECTRVPADAPFTVAEYQKLRAEFLAEHGDRLLWVESELDQRVRAFMLAHLNPEQAQLLMARPHRDKNAAAVLLCIGLTVGIYLCTAPVWPVMMILVFLPAVIWSIASTPSRAQVRLLSLGLFLLYAPMRVVTEFMAR